MKRPVPYAGIPPKWSIYLYINCGLRYRIHSGWPRVRVAEEEATISTWLQ